LPIHLEQESADFRSLALREYFLRHLRGRFFCFAQFDYSRYHSVLLNEGVKSLHMPSASLYNVASWSWYAHAVFRRARQHLEKYPWLTQLLARRRLKVVAVATAPSSANARFITLKILTFQNLPSPKRSPLRLRVLPDFGGISGEQKLERTLVLPMRLCRLNMPAPGLRE
jgi:hypothetical protein